MYDGLTILMSKYLREMSFFLVPAKMAITCLQEYDKKHMSNRVHSSSNLDFFGTPNYYANYIQGICNRLIPRGEKKTYVTNDNC
jgi:hypothetical protein